MFSSSAPFLLVCIQTNNIVCGFSIAISSRVSVHCRIGCTAMVSRRVYSDVMKLVEFHHQGQLDSFVYDQFLRMVRARYLIDLYTFQVSGARDTDGETDDNFVPGAVSDPRIRIRLIDPALTSGPTSIYDVAGRVNRAYNIARDALRREDESLLEFCLASYDVLLMEDGFVVPEVFRRWCGIKQEYVVIPMGVGGIVSRYMRSRQVAYAAWVATVRV